MVRRKQNFFDIVSTFCVGTMGVVISFVGWKTNQRSADIYQRQLEILEMIENLTLQLILK